MASRRESARAAVYAAIVLALNIYICRDLFRVPGAHMNSMHGFWIALAQRAGGSWWHPAWWPFWDNGIPFEYTYAPLVPALVAIVAALRTAAEPIPFQTVTALVYCALPLTLFLAAWRLTRLAGYSFAAALLYSLSSPTQLLAPDEAFRWSGFFASRRLFLATYWDETPHLLALVFLPLTVLFLTRTIETGRRRYLAAAALSIGAATLASTFGPVTAIMAAICLLFVMRGKNTPRKSSRTVAAGALGYGIAAAFLPPSLIVAIRQSSSNPWRGEPGWTAESLTALAIVVFGWAVLARYLPRWAPDWRLQFFALFSYLSTAIFMISAYLHRQFVPQPVRYKFEAEIGLALLIVFGLRPWFEKMPLSLRRAAIFLLIAIAIEQVKHYRADLRNFQQRADLSSTIESRASTWAAANLPSIRVMFPGSIAQWANAFSDVPQFSGGSWSMAYNRAQQIGLQAIYGAGATAQSDARISLAWLRAFGVGAVAVSAPNSEEYWKGFLHPSKFENLLPRLWSEGGVTIYGVPGGSTSLAHLLPESAIVRRVPSAVDDIADLEKYDAALMDPALPPAAMQWDGRNRIRVHAAASAGQAMTIQITYHPGWHATVNGRPAPLARDGLGLIWLRPDCHSACEVQLDYDGGFELLLFRFISAAAIIAALALLLWPVRRSAIA